MNTKIVCAIISAAGVVLSSIISALVARFSASKEIKKLKLQWEHEETTSLNAEISEVIGYAAEFSKTGRPAHGRAAAKYIASVRMKTNGNVASLLDELYDAISRENSTEIDSAISRLSAQIRDEKTKQGIQRTKHPAKK